MLFIHIDDQGLELDLTKVTYVQEVYLASSQLVVSFMGGDTITLEGWTLKKWQEMRNKAIRQITLQHNAAQSMGVIK